MRRISLKIAALVTLATLATAAPVLASSSSTMPPVHSAPPSACPQPATTPWSGASIPTAGRERGRSTAPGLTGQGRSTLMIESPGLAKFERSHLTLQGRDGRQAAVASPSFIDEMPADLLHQVPGLDCVSARTSLARVRTDRLGRPRLSRQRALALA